VMPAGGIDPEDDRDVLRPVKTDGPKRILSDGVCEIHE